MTDIEYLRPITKWIDSPKHIYISTNIDNLSNYSIDITIKEQLIYIKTHQDNTHNYLLELNLLHTINAEESKYFIEGNVIKFILTKNQDIIWTKLTDNSNNLSIYYDWTGSVFNKNKNIYNWEDIAYK